jgi:CheY-like chemotaxis protein/anti-sigma regulatory factor (Ser/Thr protein kinase)
LGFNLYMQPIREMVFFGDPVRLRQVLFNLCGNAIKFTAKGKVDITATATRSDNGVVLLFKISDTGIGIPSDKLKTIFEQYEQAARSTERFYGGTGLGLSISKKIVEQLNGNINVESEEHSGSTFSVRIPYSWGNEAEVETSYTEDPSTKPLKGITVIIAEDEPLIRELNVKFLRDNGARVYEAENGKDAIDLLQRYPADLMVMDVQMPVMTGPEAVRQIRSSFSGAKQKVPVIGMTANVLQQDLLSYIDAGMNDTITKPFTGRDLFDKITRLLELPSLITASPDGGRVSETDISEADTERTSEIKSGKMGEERGYNLKSLIDSAAGNNDFIRKMINMFLTSSYASVNNLRFHLNRQNLDQLEKTAHRMIGSAKQMGATQIATLLKDLELAARDTAPREELEHRVKEIEIRMKKMSEMLKEEVRRFED